MRTRSIRPTRERKKQRNAEEKKVEGARWRAVQEDDEEEEEIKTRATRRIFARRRASGRLIEIRNAAHVSKVRDKD